MFTKLKSPILAILFLFTFSCNTDNSDIVKEMEKPAVVNNVQKLTSNINNPYEQLGVLHNQFLANMYASNITSADVVYSSAKSFLKSKGYNTDMFTDANVKSIADVALATQPTTANLDALAISYNLSDAYKAELNKLILFLSDESHSSINEIQSKLVTIEEEYANANVTSDEKQNLLAIIVIARYSTDYWINMFPNDRPSVAKGGKWFSRILGGIIGDVVGAAVGGAVGGAIGTLAGGPAGAAIGATIGMAVGALAGSGAVQLEITKNGI